MKTSFLRKFSKDVEKLDSKAVKAAVLEIIEQIEAAETINDIRNVKKLSGFNTAYRIRLGDYRIGIFVEEDSVEFARIVHRKDIYDVFP